MDLKNTPTRSLLAEVVRQHINGHVVIGEDSSPTGTGKTTSGAHFFLELEKYLEELGASKDLKFVIIASQHRFLGNYWQPGKHAGMIRFLGSEEYARRVRDVTASSFSHGEMVVP